MTVTFQDDVVQHLCRLQSFARRLAGNRSFADDLVQETVLRALVHADQFEPGTNLQAWLMTILRNAYFSEKRRARRLTYFDPEAAAALPAPSGQQEWSAQMGDVARRFDHLPPVQREALLLVGAHGLSYHRAAALAGCAVGTMKSRVSRARQQLQALLEEGNTPPREKSEFRYDFAQRGREATAIRA
jgi:RNA polymerase sigma-70 factor, ECF subfamily